MRSRTFFAWVCGLAVSLSLGACGGRGGSIPAVPSLSRHHRATGSSPIQHVVLVIQENRSFDNLFARYPGAAGATRGLAKELVGSKYVDKWIQLAPHTLKFTYDLSHCHAAFELDYDGGKMDGFYDEGSGACGRSSPPAKTLPYQYVETSQIVPYWDIADQWVLADAMFQTQGSGSFTAHQDLIRGGTCIRACSSPSANTETLVDTPTFYPWGCDAAAGTKTSIINIYGVVKIDGPFPCSSKFPYGSGGYPTLRDLLDNAKVSWKYYTPCFSSTDQQNCTPNSNCGTKLKIGICDGDLFNAFDVIAPVRYGSEWGTNVVWPETTIISDIQYERLPAVSWVIPADNNSDHPGEKYDYGPSWVASIVNAIGQSPYWNSSVIIVVWDDWGGLYDNAVPPLQDQFGGLGFRIPTLIISPYDIKGKKIKGGYIASTQYEFGSIIKYIEQNWNLGSLGTTDVRATSIGNVFNYSQKPRPFTVIPSGHDAKFFINQPHGPQHGDPE